MVRAAGRHSSLGLWSTGGGLDDWAERSARWCGSSAWRERARRGRQHPAAGHRLGRRAGCVAVLMAVDAGPEFPLAAVLPGRCGRARSEPHAGGRAACWPGRSRGPATTLETGSSWPAPWPRSLRRVVFPALVFVVAGLTAVRHRHELGNDGHPDPHRHAGRLSARRRRLRTDDDHQHGGRARRGDLRRPLLADLRHHDHEFRPPRRATTWPTSARRCPTA